jgi:hypothetical protein
MLERTAHGADVDLGSGPPTAGSVKADALKGVTLTFVSYGGIYQDGQTQAAIDPYAKESGARVLQDGPTESSKIKAQVETGNVTWDVIDTTKSFTAQHCNELFMPLDDLRAGESGGAAGGGVLGGANLLAALDCRSLTTMRTDAHGPGRLYAI